jgi:hypothetical protein
VQRAFPKLLGALPSDVCAGLTSDRQSAAEYYQPGIPSSLSLLSPYFRYLLPGLRLVSDWSPTLPPGYVYSEVRHDTGTYHGMAMAFRLVGL